MLDFDAFSVLSFDCYGTLIDWEAGILAALRPLLGRHGRRVEDDALLEAFAALEATAEAGAWRSYAEVLSQVVDGLGERFDFEPGPGERAVLVDSIGSWPPFGDTRAALAALARRYRLAVISNVDDDLFARTAPVLGVRFEWVVTAAQVRAYKPSTENFRRALARFGVPPGRILHVAQSLFHDVAPARSLGLATVWVNRRAGRAGSGATPAATAVPDLEVPDLATLARLAGVPPDFPAPARME